MEWTESPWLSRFQEKLALFIVRGKTSYSGTFTNDLLVGENTNKGKDLTHNIMFYKVFILITTTIFIRYIGGLIINPSLSGMKKYEFNVFADYYTINIEDSESLAKPFPLDKMTHDGSNNLLNIIDKSLILVHTIRNTDVPFTLEVLDSKPDIKLDNWNQINECGFYTSSGKIYIYGTTDIPEDGFNVELKKGYYGCLICYRGLNTISEDGLTGNDNYFLYLWKEEEYISQRMVKKWIP